MNIPEIDDFLREDKAWKHSINVRGIPEHIELEKIEIEEVKLKVPPDLPASILEAQIEFQRLWKKEIERKEKELLNNLLLEGKLAITETYNAYSSDTILVTNRKTGSKIMRNGSCCLILMSDWIPDETVYEITDAELKNNAKSNFGLQMRVL